MAVPYNYLNLPAIDAAKQRRDSNNFRMQEGQKAAQRNDQEWDDEQRMKNTRWMVGASKVGMDVFKSDPENFLPAMRELTSEAVRRGLLDPDAFDLESQNPEEIYQGLEQFYNKGMIAVGGDQGLNQNRSVAKTWINPKTQTLMYLSRDGQPVDTGQPAQQYGLRPVDTAQGTVPFDPSSGATGPVIQGTDPESMRQKEAADITATEGAKVDVKAREDYVQQQQANIDTYKVYEVARNGLMAGLEGTDTGYWYGKIPPMTEGQQVAEGGVAAIAPVLKQLFRAAGEGIFTDKDQELLMDMIPTRDDLAGARNAKMENIDVIVRHKLGIDQIERLQQARNAIQKGADPELVKQRLESMGIDPRKL